MASPKRASRLLAATAGLAAIFAANSAHAISLIRDTEIEEIIREDSEGVLRAHGLNPDSVNFYLVGNKEINAFVVGGQNIFIHTGLITESETPNQLLGVIAHEAGHISGGHLIRQGDMMRAGLTPFLLTMGLGLAAALAGEGGAAGALMASSQYFGALSVLSYSRVQEAAADQSAVTALEAAGKSSKGLVEFFDNYRYQEIFSDQKRFQFFRSHPLSSDRIEALRRRAAEQSHYDTPDTEEDVAQHKLMQAKLEAFMNPPAQTFVKWGERDTSFLARYSRAIAYYKSGEADRALTMIEALIAEEPENPYLWELKGQVLFENARAAEAVPAHKRSIELKPDAPLLRINYAQALIALEDKGRLDEAIQNLGRALTEERDNAYAWRLLSQAFEGKGQPGQARLAAAEENYALGKLAEARAFAMRAREHLSEGTPDWRRATDIVLASNPSDSDLKELARETRGG